MESPWGTAKNLKETMMEAEYNHLNHATWECKYEPPRVRRRPFRLSHAASAGSSSMA
jgi:hypothetical protein